MHEYADILEDLGTDGVIASASPETRALAIDAADAQIHEMGIDFVPEPLRSALICLHVFAEQEA